MSMWKGFKNKLEVSQEAYGMSDLIQNYSMLENIEKREATTYRYSAGGRGNETKVLKFFKDTFGLPVSIQEDSDDIWSVFTDKNTYASCTVTKSKKKGPKQISLLIVTTDKSILDLIKKQTALFIEEVPPSNSVFALVNTPNGLNLTSLGEFKQKLVTENYSEKTMEDYTHIKACLSSKEPCGRLILLQGSPGTGKSYMIRSLVSKVDSTFIIVGSNMIADLSGPAVLPTLLSTSDSSPDGKPITFILEDADVALADRKSAGMNHLSGLLNLGDGLLGEMMDVRIIATTNAGRLDLDKAIIRPGRMCQHITFDALSTGESNALYAKLVGATDTQIKKPLTLAEVYRLARRDGWVPPKPPRVEGQYV